jgi:4-amino-4-deoxy-L-arabinose transferase-like glycosyltransferase
MASSTPASSASAPHPQKAMGSRTWSSVLYSPAWMAAVGLAVRIVCIAAGRLYQLDITHWTEFEMANIGYSLALGHGFASPFGGSTGPTAWTAPLYPWLVSVAFRVFGAYSDGAAFALLTLNSVFSALTCWTIYRIARRVFNGRVAAWSGWIWALFPYAIYWSVTWIWETTLSAFLLSLLFMVTLEMEGDNRLWPWIRYGLLWGFVALSNTSALAWLPFSGCWMAYQLHRSGKRFLGPVVLSAVVFWVVITPWLVRNYVVFDKLIFIRGDLGAELHTGNNPLAKGTWVPAYRAGNNSSLYAQYKRMGEVAYDAEQGRLARNWIAEDPWRFLALSSRRLYYFWFGLPEPGLLRWIRPLFMCLTMLSIGGLLLIVRQRIHGVFLFATLLVFYPLIYYLTFPTDRYHHAIEPELVLLAVWLLASNANPATAEASPPARHSVSQEELG